MKSSCDVSTIGLIKIPTILHLKPSAKIVLSVVDSELDIYLKSLTTLSVIMAQGHDRSDVVRVLMTTVS